MTATKAANILQDIRNEIARWGHDADFEQLMTKVDEIGNWAASQIAKKWTKKLDKICDECDELFRKYGVS